MLAKRGFDARSLAGGMKAWSLAWNAAEVPLTDASVRVIQVRRTGKGCLSYIVASAGEAAVIDPSVSPDVYIELASRHGWSIRYVLETHVHADHLSRARELAQADGRDAPVASTAARQVRVYARSPMANVCRWETPASPPRTRPVTPNESTSYALERDRRVHRRHPVHQRRRAPGPARRPGGRAPASSRPVRVTHPLAGPSASHRRVARAHRRADRIRWTAGRRTQMGEIATWLSGWLASEAAFVERVTSQAAADAAATSPASSI